MSSMGGSSPLAVRGGCLNLARVLWWGEMTLRGKSKLEMKNELMEVHVQPSTYPLHFVVLCGSLCLDLDQRPNAKEVKSHMRPMPVTYAEKSSKFSFCTEFRSLGSSVLLC